MYSKCTDIAKCRTIPDRQGPPGLRPEEGSPGNSLKVGTYPRDHVVNRINALRPTTAD
jgi:hypothetical protein